MNRLRFPALAVLAALIMAFVVVPATASAQPAASYSVPVTGTFTDAQDGVGTFDGAYEVQNVDVQDGALVATGVLTGTLTDSLGNVVGTVDQSATMPVGLQEGSTCDILFLELGPLDLDLLGLQVHLDQVVLDITAEQGEGNLLGNLLCAVTGLLDPDPSGGVLNGVANLLNQILGLLSV